MALVDVEGEDKGVLKGFIMGGETTSCQIVGFFWQIFIKSNKWITEKFGMDLIGPSTRVQPGNLHLKKKHVRFSSYKSSH